MRQMNQWGANVSPNHSPLAILDNLIHAWGYNRHDPENQIRAQSLRLRNIVDEAIGAYVKFLRDEITQERLALGTPTRDKPLPGPEQFQAVREHEAFVQKIESLRTKIQGLAVPTKDIVWRTQGEHLGLLDALEQLDRRLFESVRNLNVESLSEIEQIVGERNALLNEYIAGPSMAGYQPGFQRPW